MKKIDLGEYYLRFIEHKLEDMVDVFEYASSENVTKYTTFPRHQTIEDTRWTFDNIFFKLPEEGLELPHVIVERKTKKVIGMINFHYIKCDDGSKVREIGYILNDNYWGRGIMTKALKKMVEHGFNDLGYERIDISHEVGNIGSQRVIEKAGFIYAKNIFRKVGEEKKEYRLYYLGKKKYSYQK